MEIPEPPPCPPKLKAYLMELVRLAKTAQPIQGRGVTVNEHQGQGTIVNADDCASCP
jgi:hypothetical protein